LILGDELHQQNFDFAHVIMHRGQPFLIVLQISASARESYVEGSVLSRTE